jgi:hypothetical protein
MKQLLENFKKVLEEQNDQDLALCIVYDAVLLIYEPNSFYNVVQQSYLKEKNLADKYGEKMDKSTIYDDIVSLRLDKSKKVYVATIFMTKATSMGHGKCSGAWEVTASAVEERYQGKGFGKLLYGLAMVLKYPDPIMSDRSSVSKSARRMYQKFEKNPKIEKLPDDKLPYTGEFDDIEEPKTLPKSDDCVLQNDPELNKAYRYNSVKNKNLFLIINTSFLFSIIIFLFSILNVFNMFTSSIF